MTNNDEVIKAAKTLKEYCDQSEEKGGKRMKKKFALVALIREEPVECETCINCTAKYGYYDRPDVCEIGKEEYCLSNDYIFWEHYEYRIGEVVVVGFKEKEQKEDFR